MRVAPAIGTLLISVATVVYADTVSVPNTFINGTVANASKVNENFTALADESNENDIRVGAMEGGKFVTPDISLSNNDAGIGNTLFGDGAGGSIVVGGNNNSAFGAVALTFNTTGVNNTANGAGALGFNTTGSDNTASGYRSLLLNSEGSFNTASGKDALFSNTTGNLNTASGYLSLYSNTTGGANTAIGHRTLYSNTTGDFNTAIGHRADVSSGNLSNATAIGTFAKVNASNKVRIGGTLVTVIEGNVAFSPSSDRRLKEDIHTTSLGLEFINDLNPVQYHRINNSGSDTEMGLVAQELQETLEKHNASDMGMVHQVGDDMMSVRYNDLVAPMIKSIQQLSAENAAQVNEIAMLKSDMAELKALVLASTSK